jgi:hypothetical protein
VYDNNPQNMGLWRSGFANGRAQAAFTIALVIAILGLHFHSQPLLLMGIAAISGASIYDIFCRRGALVIKVAMTVTGLVLTVLMVRYPAQTFIDFQHFADHANSFLSPKGK